jgi:hypothetical protein
VIGREPRRLDIDGIGPRRQSGESELPSLVGRRALLSADQCRRGDTNDCSRENPSLHIPHSADECPGQCLRRDNLREQGHYGQYREETQNKAHDGIPFNALK